MSDDGSMEIMAEDNDSNLITAMPRYLYPGFTLCWDNVGKKVTTLHPSPATNSTYLNMAFGIIAINRVPATKLIWDSSDELVKVADIPGTRRQLYTR